MSPRSSPNSRNRSGFKGLMVSEMISGKEEETLPTFEVQRRITEVVVASR